MEVDESQTESLLILGLEAEHAPPYSPLNFYCGRINSPIRTACACLVDRPSVILFSARSRAGIQIRVMSSDVIRRWLSGEGACSAEPVARRFGDRSRFGPSDDADCASPAMCLQPGDSRGTGDGLWLRLRLSLTWKCFCISLNSHPIHGSRPIVIRARSMPGVTIQPERKGLEAERFHLSISGQTAIYAPDGHLFLPEGSRFARP